MKTPRSVYIALFTLTASLGMVFALLPELQDDVGFANSLLGVVGGGAFFSSVAAQLLLAPAADRGHARVLMVGSVIVAALGSIWFALASTFPELLAARLLAGFGIGGYLPAARAVVAASAPGREGSMLGRLSAVETAGFVSGPVLGAIVFEVWGLDAPFLLVGILLLATAPALVRIPLPKMGLREPAKQLAVMRNLLTRREPLAAILLGGALFLPAGMYEAIWARFMLDLGASTLFVGLSLSFYGIPFSATAALVGSWIDRRGPWPAMALALAMIVPLTMIYGFLTSPLILMLLAAVEAVGNGAGIPAAQAAMAAATGEGDRAAGQGLVAAAGQIGAGMAALLAAPLYAGPGPEVTFMVVAIVVLVMGGLGLWLGRGARSAVRP